MIYLLYGFGISNASLAKYLKQQNVEFAILDDSEASQKKATEAGYKLFSEDLWDQVSLVVVTPGVSRNAANPVVARCRNAGIQVTNDVSMFMDLCSGFRIGVTGSFGKSTSVKLFKHIYDEFLSWKKADSNIFEVEENKNAANFTQKIPLTPFQIAGNFGIPCFDCDPSEPTIFELSAQQLQISNPLKLEIGVILNLYEQHLDDFGTMENYLEAKKRILKNSTIKIVGDGVGSIPGAKRISTKNSENCEYAMVNKIIYEKNVEIAEIETHFSPDSIITAYAIAREMGIPAKIIIEGITSNYKYLKEENRLNKDNQYKIKPFRGLEHRCEVVEVENRFIINDSKSTNIANTVYCINSFKNLEKIALICGGKKIKQNLGLLDSVIDKIAFVACTGSCKEVYDYFVKKQVPLLFGSLEDCLDACWKIGIPIIFSPGHPSTDEYKNFEERGNIFKKFCQTKKLLS